MKLFLWVNHHFYRKSFFSFLVDLIGHKNRSGLCKAFGLTSLHYTTLFLVTSPFWPPALFCHHPSFTVSSIQSMCNNIYTNIYNIHKRWLAGTEGKLGCLLQSLKFYDNVFLSVYLTTLGTGKFSLKLNVQTFQPLIVMYRRSNFVYHHWVCT